MKERCVTHAGSNQFLEFDGNAQSVLITMFVRFVIMPINIHFDTDSQELLPQKVEGKFH